MAFLIDSERPTTLDGLTHNDSVTRVLKGLARQKDIPHLLFYGPTGAGKMTRILCLLREIFGPGALKAKRELRTIKPKASGPEMEIQVISSSYHIEIAPSEVGSKDVLVIQHLVKEMAQAPPVGGAPFKVVVINNAHCLSRAAQAGLRRTMEKYVSVLKIFFHADSLAPLIPPLRSRCMAIRVPRPSIGEVQSELEKVEAKHGVEMNPQLSSIIANASGGDMRFALLQLDAMAAQNGGRLALRNANTPLAELPWKSVIESITQDILAEQTPRQLKIIRDKLYGLLAVEIPPNEMFYQLLVSIGSALGESQDSWPRLAALSSKFESRLYHAGNKPIFHFEALIANAMRMCLAQTSH